MTADPQAAQNIARSPVVLLHCVQFIAPRLCSTPFPGDGMKRTNLLSLTRGCPGNSRPSGPDSSDEIWTSRWTLRWVARPAVRWAVGRRRFLRQGGASGPPGPTERTIPAQSTGKGAVEALVS